MAEVDFSKIKPNSNKYKETEKAEGPVKPERERLKSVVSHDNVVTTKKPFSKKLFDWFLGDEFDDAKELKDYIIKDMLLPGIKDFGFDVIERIFYPDTARGGRFRRRGSSGSSYRYGGTSYSKYYEDKRRRSSRSSSSNRSSRDRRREEDDKLDYKNIVVKERRDAEEIIDALCERIERTGSATVAELFDLIDEPGSFTDNEWGWTSTRQIGLRKTSNGWLIDVDTARYLD